MAVMGVLTVLNPNMKIHIYFIIPMPLWVATIAFALYSGFVSVIGGAGAGNVAQLAHLTGLGIGLLYGVKVKEQGKRGPSELDIGGRRRRRRAGPSTVLTKCYLAHPEFAPDASLSRAEMEALQYEVAETAIFEDEFEFDLRAFVPNRRTRNRHISQRETGTIRPLKNPLSSSAWTKRSSDDFAVSALVASRDGEVIERAHAAVETEIPYIPGLLSFREGTAILRAFEKLTVEPDLAIVDGSGRIHFREAGIATHIGVMLDIPAIGVAKNLLCGDLRDPPQGHLSEGKRVPVVANSRVSAPDGTVIGYALQSRQYPNPEKRHVNPLYVSPGHRVSAETAADLVWKLCAGYKLPEPTRRADAYADEVKETVDT